MKNYLYWRYETLTLKQVVEIMNEMHATMAIRVTTGVSSSLYSVSVYGTYEGDAEDWGLEDATLGMFQGEPNFEETKKLYETLKENGQF